MQRVPKTKTDPPPADPASSRFEEDAEGVEVWYDYKELTITFTSPEGACTVGVYNNETGASTRCRIPTTESSTIVVGPIRNGTLKMKTSLGNEYVGPIF